MLLVISACSSSDGTSDTGEGDQPGDGDGGLLDDDGSADGPTLTVCGSGTADYQTIAEAIAGAPAGAVLALCGGTYQERVAIEGKPLTIRGVQGAAATVIDGGGHGVTIAVRDTGNGGVTIERLTIRGGANGGSGGGIRCEASGLRLTGDVVRDNRGAGGGGLFTTGCEIAITDTSFADNDGGDRGGGALLLNTTGEVSGSEFEGNQAVYGGGVAVVGGTIALSGNQLRQNIAELRGGGIYLDADASVEDNLIADNTAGWTAGGIHVNKHAPLLRADQVKDNISMNDGGGIYLHQSRAHIVDCDITGNSSGDDGGGIRIFESSALVEQNRISGNVTADGGGGIRVSHVASQFIDNQIHDNQAYMGGGMDMDNDSSVVRGGLVADNQATVGGGISATRFPWNGSLFDGVRITGNHADSGGGMYLSDNFVTLTLIDVELSDNDAARGAGLYVRATNVNIHNALIARNQADGEGGGLRLGVSQPWTDPCPCPPTSPAVDLDFAVIDQNRAAEGSALWSETAGLSVTSSILSGNQAPAVVATGGDPAWSYNDTTPASFAGMVDPTGSAGNISADPQYADQAFRLAGGSPCVNAGDPSLADPDGSRADMGRFGGPEATQ